MIRKRVGLVVQVLAAGPGISKVAVIVEGRRELAVNYNDLTGPVSQGDLVLLNTTALHLGLGTGGVHFVYHNFSRPLPPFQEGGHIMKMRYAPGQLKVLSCEEEAAGYREQLEAFGGLQGMPVLIGELHSMLAPAAAVIKYYQPRCRLVYLMTDGAALPLAFSRTVAELKEKGLIQTTITCGHAFGGDLEAVNVYSGLAAARQIAGADLVIITMGPGNVGTGTRLGFSGMEVGEHVNRVYALGGIPVVIPRLSWAERRRRHRGISHHTLTALKIAALAPACLPLPAGLPPGRLKLLLARLSREGLLRRHRWQLCPVPPLERILESFGLEQPTTMGRSFREDPDFFLAAGAAGLAALKLTHLYRREGEWHGGKIKGNAAGIRRPVPGTDHQCPAGPGPHPGGEGRFPRSSGTPGRRGHPGPGRGGEGGLTAAIPASHRPGNLGDPGGEAGAR